MHDHRQLPRVFARSIALAFAVLALLALALGHPATAQFEAGDLFGSITDEAGEPLPKVKVTLTCDGSRYVGETDERGQVRFGSLAPGNYAMRAEHADFEPVVYKTVEILVGRPTTVHLRMAQDSEHVRVITS
jgi:carboxypeptidase family protein